MTTTPLISVILPTYNGSRYIKDTLQSVLDQSYKNLEIIIIDDCSTDNSVEIIKTFTDNRIRLYVNDNNLGIAQNTNKALNLSTGEYIMMQDHDDISMPLRAEMMLSFLMSNPELTGVGSSSYQITGDDNAENFEEIREPILSISTARFKCTELFDTLLFHPTIMYRKSILEKVDKPYSTYFKIGADLDFINQLNSVGAKWAILDNKYLKYRRHKKSLSNNSYQISYKDKISVMRSATKRLIKIATDEELSLHSKAVCRKEVLSYKGSTNSSCISWYQKIIDYNLTNKIFDHKLLLETMADNWIYFVTLSNIFTPIKGMQMYHSIGELRPYLKSNVRFLKEWQKRFFRAMSWILLGNKRLGRKS